MPPKVRPRRIPALSHFRVARFTACWERCRRHAAASSAGPAGECCAPAPRKAAAGRIACPTRLKVTEPPIVSALFQSGKPQAERVEQGDYADPYGVHDRERIAEVGWIKLRLSAYRWQGLQEKGCVAVTDKGERDGE